MARDLVSNNVIGATRDINGRIDFWNALDAGRVEREDREGCAPFIHSFQPLLIEIEEIGFKSLPNHWLRIDLRLIDRKVDRERLFQRNFVLQVCYSGEMTWFVRLPQGQCAPAACAGLREWVRQDGAGFHSVERA